MSLIEERLEKLHADIQMHATAGGGTPGAVQIVAVTKHATPQQMAEAYDAGIRDFGENKLQNAEAQIAAFHALRPNAAVNWHFIGHLQSNKASKVIGQFSLIHSVDSIKLAQKLSEAALSQGVCQAVFLQINISGEESKFGFTPDEVRAAIPALRLMSGIKLCGLMSMAPLSEDPAVADGVFGGLSSLRDQLEETFGIDLPELSMGMSKDYVPALKNGATIIRVGTLLFGSS